MQDEHAVINLERELLNFKTRASALRLKHVLADGFIEFGQSGTLYDKQDIITDLRDERPKTIADFNMGVRLFTNGLALVSYQTKTLGKNKVQRYSLWENKQNGWQIFYHEAEQRNG